METRNILETKKQKLFKLYKSTGMLLCINVQKLRIFCQLFRDILCLCCVREISFNLLSLKDECLENKTRYQESESDLKVYAQMKSVFLS